MRRAVYLAGPINACSDTEARDWREYVKANLPDATFLDPMVRDYRGRELGPAIAREIVEGDKADIACSDVLLAYAPKPSVGTSMEVFYAYHSLGKRVVIVHPGHNPSPWLIRHSDHIVKTLDDGIAMVKELIW